MLHLLMPFVLAWSQEPQESPAVQALARFSVHEIARMDEFEELKRRVDAEPSLLTLRDDDRRTILHLASRYGPPEAVAYLLGKCADPSARAYNEFTPLHLTTDPSIAKLLIEAGAPLDSKSAWDMTPLRDAVEDGSRAVVDVLIEAGQVLDLNSLIELRKFDTALTLLEENPELAKAESNQRHMTLGRVAGSPIDLATMHGSLELVQRLVELGADPGRTRFMINAGEANALTYAVLAGHDDITRYLCELGVSPKTSGGRGAPTLLHAAVQHSAPEIVPLLLEAGAEVDGLGSRNGERPLALAARLGRADVVRALLEAGADPYAPDDTNGSPVHLAAAGGHRDAVDALLEAGAPLDIYVAAAMDRVADVEAAIDRTPEALDTPDPAFERPPLLWAVGVDAFAVVRRLLVRGADPKAAVLAADVSGDLGVALAKAMGEGQRETALHVAVRGGDVSIVEALLDAGADIDAPGERGATPLVLAIASDNLDVFRLLLERGADPDGIESVRRRIPLLECTGKENELQFARLLLDAGADLALTDAWGSGPMSRAIAWRRADLAGILEVAGAPVDLPTACVLGDVERVTELLAEHPDFDAFERSGQRTPFEAAAESGNLELVRMLLDATSSFEPNGETGAMLLHAAARAENTSVLRWALDRVYVEIHRNLMGGTALGEAAAANRPEAVRVLLDAGARLNHYGGSALHAAAASGALAAAEVLVERGAPLDARNGYGQTPLGLAASRSQLAAVTWLVEAGADVNARSWRGLTPLGEALRLQAQRGDPFASVLSDGRDVGPVVDYLREHCALE